MKKYYIESLIKFFPFTFLGVTLFIFLLCLTGNSFNSKSSYDLLVALSGQAVLLFLFSYGRLFAYRQGLTEFQWDTSTKIYSHFDGNQHWFRYKPTRTWLFLRIHVLIGWRLESGNSNYLYSYSDSCSSGQNMLIPMWFPVSGKLNVSCIISIQDVFGLTRNQIFPIEHRQLIVHPGFTNNKLKITNARPTGTNDFQPRHLSDEEKYFMRDYVPGDKMKDINWKTSSRLNQLITRISPLSLDKEMLLQISFRHYKFDTKETLSSTLHLEYLKRELLSFIQQMKMKNDKTRFLVESVKEQHLIETETDFNHFSKFLSELTFAPELPSRFNSSDDIYIFSTVFDGRLNQFVEECLAKKCHVFQTIYQTNTHKREAQQMSINQSLLPTIWGGKWIFKKAHKNYKFILKQNPKIETLEQQAVNVSNLCFSYF